MMKRSMCSFVFTALFLIIGVGLHACGSDDAASTPQEPFTKLEVKKLTASDAKLSDRFATSVAISGDLAVVGADNENSKGTSAGAAYVFHRNAGGPGNWGEVRKLTASDALPYAKFGGSVAISGDFIVVGATGSGAAYVFHRDAGGPGNWGQVKILTAFDAGAAERFGSSVSISGDKVVVGAYYENTGGSRAGATYVFYRNAGGPDNWTEVKKLIASDAGANDNFGSSVSISGDHIIVGAFRENELGINAGAAYVFYRDTGGPDNWGEVRKLTASDAGANDNFGSSVSISGDLVIVGAPGIINSSSTGAAYVFCRDEGGTDNWGEVKKLTASDAGAGDWFGSSVSISGDRAVVGASFEDSRGTKAGAAYVFYRDKGGSDNWGEANKLMASDAEAGDWFGGAVAISGEGSVVGASLEDPGLITEAGAAYIY